MASITYSVMTLVRGIEDDEEVEHPAKTLEEAEAIFANLVRAPGENLIEVELVQTADGKTTSCKTWWRE